MRDRWCRVDRYLGWLSLALMLCVSSDVAQGASVRFGFSGLHGAPLSVLEAMDDEARRAFVSQRVEIAPRLGASILRTGDVTPLLFDREQIFGGDHPDWLAVDHAVGVLLATGLEVCVTLPDLVTPADQAAFVGFLQSFVERYDGDTDFGVPNAELNWAFPDINGSGSITSNDWDADPESLQSWAQAHRVGLLEIGVRPRAAELSGDLGETDYAAHLQAALETVMPDPGGVSVVLAGTQMHDQSKQDFVTRLAPLSDEARGWLAVTNVHVQGELSSSEPGPGVMNLSRFGEWLDAADIAHTERWVGALAIPSSSQAGPCGGGDCDERSQAANLVRLVAEALREEYSVILYDQPIEVLGTEERGGAGLLTVEAVPGMDISLVPLKPRPAYAVWRKLVTLFEGVELSTLAGVHSAPQGTDGVSVAGGWLLWYDWMGVLGDGAPYDGSERPVILTNLTSPSVRVTSLWPGEVAAQLDEAGTSGAVWDEELLTVVDGAVQIMLRQDPVWVEPSDEVVGVVEEDAGSASDLSNQPLPEEDIGPIADSAPPLQSNSSGCNTSPGRSHRAWALWGLLCLLMLRHWMRASGCQTSQPSFLRTSCW